MGVLMADIRAREDAADMAGFKRGYQTAQAEANEHIEAARQEGYEKGRAVEAVERDDAEGEAYNEGFNDGYAEGEDTGFNEGVGDGYDDGYADGYAEGYGDGFDQKQPRVFG
jgi:flagellar biosynthesis/type III secretory pathway protein FliH